MSSACKDELSSFDSPAFNAITLLEISIKKDRYIKTNIQLYAIFNFWCFIVDKYRFSRRLFLVWCPRALAFDLTLKLFQKYSEKLTAFTLLLSSACTCFWIQIAVYQEKTTQTNVLRVNIMHVTTSYKLYYASLYWHFFMGVIRVILRKLILALLYGRN